MIIKFGKVVISVFLLSISFLLMLVAESNAEPRAQSPQWESPFDAGFDSLSGGEASLKDSLALAEVLSLVAKANPSLRASRKRIEATKGAIVQAGLRPNPELDIEAEQFSGNAPGFRESEINITLSQEFELWGKRGARKTLAKSEAEIVRLNALFADFDLYATTVGRFFEATHAQERVKLSLEASETAQSVVETARVRMEKGAALRSELLLAELELGRAQLNLSEAESELVTAKERLSALWQDTRSNFTIRSPKTNLTKLTEIENLQPLVENSRGMNALSSEERSIRARLNLEQANGKPNITLSGGLKRLEADKANTFIIGAGLPLPFFNRNQGSKASLRASIEAVKLDREQMLTASHTEFNSIKRRLAQAASRYRSVSSSLLPKAEETYSSLKSAYDIGRIPYSILLESQRTLIDLRFELNDIDFTIREELVALERLLGVTIN